MKKPGKSPFEEVQHNIDIRLGGLLGELGSALNEAIEKLGQDGTGEIRTERTFDSGNGPVRASAGVRIRTLGGSAPGETRAFDQPINTPERDVTPEVARPAATPRPITATILDGPERWQLVAELPGVDIDGVTLEPDGRKFSITAAGRARSYHSTFDLPDGAEVSALSINMQNGILEVAFQKSEAR
jgi:HSP20 family molecular chaperone IbpA